MPLSTSEKSWHVDPHWLIFGKFRLYKGGTDMIHKNTVMGRPVCLLLRTTLYPQQKSHAQPLT